MYTVSVHTYNGNPDDPTTDICFRIHHFADETDARAFAASLIDIVSLVCLCDPDGRYLATT